MKIEALLAMLDARVVIVQYQDERGNLVMDITLAGDGMA